MFCTYWSRSPIPVASNWCRRRWSSTIIWITWNRHGLGSSTPSTQCQCTCSPWGWSDTVLSNAVRFPPNIRQMNQSAFLQARLLWSLSRRWERARELAARGGFAFFSPNTLSLLWACRIALAVARCEFWDCSRNPLGTLGMSDRSPCGAKLIFIVKEILRIDLDKEVFSRELARRSWQCRELF